MECCVQCMDNEHCSRMPNCCVDVANISAEKAAVGFTVAALAALALDCGRAAVAAQVSPPRAWAGLGRSVAGLVVERASGGEPADCAPEDVPVLQREDLQRAEAIVILGAGQRRHMPEYGGPTPNRLALERLRYGARLARSSRLPVLVSGGAPTGYVAEADLMAACLREDFGWLHAGSKFVPSIPLATRTDSASILQAENIRRIVLVTHAAHMRRAQGEFECAGIRGDMQRRPHS